ncbi:MAG TPA: hypothetical protein VMM18_14215 [Gemmatimonadaceae bacterium]|nr:hypothetical protein [Gemmatimonadaceae bacterium]
MTSAGVRAPEGEPGEIAGRNVVLRYSNSSAEYAALRSAAVVTDRSHRARTHLEGAKAAELLTGIVTNDVLSLEPGHGQYAAALTAKGKIVADVRVFAEEGSLLIDVPPRAAAGWWEILRKYVNPRMARYHDHTSAVRTFGVFGTEARRIVAAVSGVDRQDLEALAPLHFVATRFDEERLRVVRSPAIGLEGYELFIEAAVAAALWGRLLAEGATPMGLEAWEIARIEAGMPEWGLDIDDSTIPQEANFDELHAISYTKGCYTGQETVARVHFRGHVNRHLRGLRFAGAETPPARTQLIDPAGKVVGDARSSAISPRLGGVAIGMVRREIEAGTKLSTGDGLELEVAMLPFAL